ncbi:DEAD/DEAH box helicase family protein [Lacticaseibacillus saniviri]|uniref:DEAD/DEAH box helicase family protein n=1 Tax=Lacticaseibacillus saniviri TaxID=931533 RepID=UPI001CDB0C73|nr:DEAD/DEAH box helicase family protein [Lacticaseibacillus saniviri]
MGKLRVYQQKLVDQVRKSLTTGYKRVLVQSPAGSGKTATMAEIAKKLLNAATECCSSCTAKKLWLKQRPLLNAGALI